MTVVVAPMVVNDLIWVLLGFEGDLFQRSDNDTLTITKAGIVNFQEWDLCVLRKILRTSQLYMIVRDYVERMSSQSDVNCRGFADAIQDEVLTIYETDVSRLEKEILFLSSENSISLTNVKCRICDKWDDVLGKLSMMIHEDKSEHIVDLLIQIEQECVVKSSREIFSKIKSRMMSIFFREIVYWVTYGVSVRNELEVPVKLFDEVFRLDVIECGELAKILHQNTLREISETDLPNDFDYCENDFVMTEKIKRYVCERKREVNEEYLQYIRVSISPTLDEHLAVIRGVFLLGFGDLWEEYILTGDFGVFEKVSKIVHMSDRGIGMNVGKSVESIIRTEHLEEYEKLCKWLISIKRTLVNMTREKSRIANMVQFVTNLFTFIQQDVVEEEWVKLKRAVEQCLELKVIQRAHETFVHAVISESMFGLPSLRNSIDEILAECSRVVGRKSHRYDARESERLFMLKAEEFIQSLVELRMRSDFRRIDRLLIRLDFNRFYNPLTHRNSKIQYSL